MILSGKLGPALALGNTVVVKPPPAAPMAVLEFCRLFAEEMPPGVLNVISGEEPELGETLVAADVDMVSFTGSSAVGRQIMETCGRSMKRSLMELGGKSANIVFADCPVEAALEEAQKAWTFQSGQACVAPTRLLIEAPYYEEFTERLVALAATLKIGPPDSDDVAVGPLISRAQLEKVEGYVASALAEGATIACGGRRPPHLEHGLYYEPTLLTNATNTMKVAREEIFGPVITAIPFRDEAHAIALANDNAYGLSGYVSSGDRERALRVARAMRTGNVLINAAPPRLDTPFGGYKQSGIGRDHGLYSIPAYTEQKFIGWPPR